MVLGVWRRTGRRILPVKSTMFTPEDIETLHGVINSLTSVRSGLTEEDSEQRDLLNQALIPVRTLILQQAQKEKRQWP